MKKAILRTATLLALVTAGPVLAQSACEAYFAFDGNLQDSSGNGYHGTSIAGEAGTGSGKVSFVDGKFGQAAHFDGSAAMRALLDLHYASCPQVTITGWIRAEQTGQSGTEFIVSTGSGDGPGFRLMGERTLVMDATGNGLWQRDAIRGGEDWYFFAGVWDYSDDTYTLYWRNRTQQGSINTRHRPPEDSLWVGALNDGLSGLAAGIYVDELRITGSALSAEQIAALRTSDAAQSAASAASLPACSSAGDCAAGTYCAYDNTCHPESHLPKQSLELGVVQTDPAPGGIIMNSSDSSGGKSLEELQAELAQRNAEATGDLSGLDESAGGSGPIELGYASEEEALAAAERRAQQEAQGDATEPTRIIRAVRYDGDILVHSGVSGGEGDYTERRDFKYWQSFPYWIETRENFDKPCTVYVHHGEATSDILGRISGALEFDVCEEGLPRINPLTTLDRLLNDPDPGQFKPVTAIQVCNNGINNRVKGIRGQVRNVNYPDGNRSASYSTVVFQEQNNCINWEPLAHCPGNSFAVGLTLHFRDGDPISPRDFLSGIELLCTEVYWAERRDEPGATWTRL